MADLLDYLSEKYPQESVDEVNRRLLELSSLFEISQLLNESLELNRVLNNVLFIPMGRLMIPRGAIILRMEGHCRLVMSKGLPKEATLPPLHDSLLPGGTFKLTLFDEADPGEVSPELAAFARENQLKIAIPFLFNKQPLGMMLFGAKLTQKPFSSQEVDFLNSLANLAANTIDNALQLDDIKSINHRLDGKIQELRTLFDINKGLSATLDYDQILKLLVYALLGQLLITRYLILLRQGDSLGVHENKGFKSNLVDLAARLLLKEKTGENAIRIEDIESPSLKKVLSDHEVRCLIPMRHQEKLLGFILLGPKMSGPNYEDDDLDFLTTLVGQAVISLENARLFQETLEKQRLEEELNLARNIQKKLLPKSLPKIAGYDIDGMNSPSRQVGGDYFDVITIDENRTAFAIADVSGKGVPASLLMANMQAALRVTMTPAVDLPEAVARINKLVHQNTDLDKFITAFIGILDTRDNTFQYVNAGHNNPHYYHNGELNLLNVGGLLLGVMPVFQYETGTIQLSRGDVVMMYTDGVNEAIAPDGDEFGDPRLEALTAELQTQPMAEQIRIIFKSINDFSAGLPQADDVTMLGIRRLP
ncbi:MAG TPA: SpoIIE family protein phosphatase [Calditrichia bacterium]|nr:SpoIIE family protein phosphatase [Calditrichia bacterium]